jgi:hypothetical protein
MRLTIEQRMRDIERKAVVLNDTMEVLHKLLKEQQKLIKDYIVQRFRVNSKGGSDGNGRDEDGMYIFVCQKRFKRLENDFKKICKQVNEHLLELKVG